MAIRRASKSSISTLSAGKRFNLIAGYSPAVDEMDLIERVTVGTATTSIIFSNIPQTYQHLQIRITGRLSSNQQGVWVRFNDDAAANYSCHLFYGTGATATGAARLSDGGIDSILPWNSTDWFAGIIDVVDYTLTTKHKMTKSISSADANGAGLVGITTGSWRNTAAVTKIHLSEQIGGSSFQQHTTAALYGVI